ncbi:MAG: HD-GYP domain-containing protein [Clostridia bacterium]
MVPLSHVKEDYILGKTIYDDQGRVLLMRGVLLRISLVQKLKELGYSSVYIYDGLSTGEIEDILKPQIRQKAVSTLYKTISDMVRLSEEKADENTAKKLKKKTYKNIETLRDVSSEIVNELMVRKDVMVNLADIKTSDNFTYAHSVNVAVLSLVLGISLGLNRYELNDLALGALLHDIGIIFTPKEIARRRKALNDKELKQYKLHTQKGYEHLGTIMSVKPVVKIIALQHHEQINGGGYPLEFDGSKINKLAKIVAIADSYDILTSNVDDETPVPPHEALEYMMGNGGQKFEIDMVNEFIKKIVPYPVGTMVKLSNNEIGIVSDVNADFPWRPTVTIVKDDKLNNSINLLEAKNITILGVQYSF